MRKSRLPRFARTGVIPMILTDRDRQIVRLVHRHRFLRSSHIYSLMGGSEQQVLRRLRLLYHHGYLERPRAQLEYYHRSGSAPIVYGLGRKSMGLLNTDNPSVQHERNDSRVERIFLKHSLLVADVMVALELACRKAGDVRLVYDHALRLDDMDKSRPFEWKVNIGGGITIAADPDCVFALDFKNIKGEEQRIVFFLEADRGTMPVVRKSLTQTSFYRKLLAYEASWAQSIHSNRFGFDRIRVLTVTTVPGRVKSLIAGCSKLERGQGLFLFADSGILKDPARLFSAQLQNGRGQVVTLLG
jgi:hypothetical protein